jgi:hypothetical protein
MIVTILITIVVGFILYSFLMKKNSNNNEVNISSRKNNQRKEEEVIADPQMIQLQSKFNLSRHKGVTVNLTLVRLHKHFKIYFLLMIFLQNRVNNLKKDEIAFLESLQTIANVFLLFESQSDESENQIKQAVLDILPFYKTNSHRLLFHETAKGKIAFVRQLKPVIHLESELHILKELSPHVPHVVLYSAEKPNLSNETPSISDLHQLLDFSKK